MEYIPYGKEWQSMLKRYSFKDLFRIFGIKKKKENKSDYILRIRKELLSQKQF